MRQKRCTQRGVTLIELLVVVAAISAIGGLGIVGVSGVQQSARERKLQSDVATINSAIQLHIANGGAMADTSSPQAVLNSLKARDTAAKSVGLRGSSIDPRTTAVALPAAEVASTTLRAVWIAADNGFTATRAGSGVREFMLDDSLSTTASSGDRTPLLKVSQASGWVWDHSAAPEAPPATQIVPKVNLNIAAANAADNQGFDTGIFGVDPDGDGTVGINYVFREAGYNSRLALVSMEGMGSDVFNLDTAEGVRAFMLEALRRVIEGDRGQTIIDTSQSQVGFNQSYQFRPGDTLFAILVPNESFQTAFDHVQGGGNNDQIYPLTTLQRNSGQSPFRANQFASLGRGSGAFAIEDVVGDGSDRDYQDLIFKATGLLEPPGSQPLTLDPVVKYRTDPLWNAGNPTLRQSLINANIIPANTPI